MSRKNKPKPSAGSVPTYEATTGLVVTDINEIRRLLRDNAYVIGFRLIATESYGNNFRETPATAQAGF